MTFKYATGVIASYGDGVNGLVRDSVVPSAILPTLPTFNAAATTQPLEITLGGVGGSNRRNSQDEIDAHAASEAALLAIPKTPDQTAAQDGWWDDTATWGGTIPVADDHVLIPAGIKVWIKTNIPKIKTCFNKGFFGVWEDSSVSITIEIETFIGDRTSMFWIGDVTRPIMGSVTWTQPQTSLNLTDDPKMLGKGIILLGRCSKYGKMVTPYIFTNGTDLMAGATTVTLASAPVNWQVGDEIVIPPTTMLLPTSLNSNSPDPGNEVERRTIATISGAVVTWTGGLSFDHDMPTEAKNKGDDAIYINNLTRHIRFDSPSGAAVHERGHFMLMHTNGDANIHYVEYAYMGRTDKRVNGWAFALHPDQPTMTATSNIFGRYQLHFHLNGPDAVDGNHVEGCSFHNGFGLGCVVHGSQADVINNCSADFSGAHYLSEAGNEAGILDGWVAIGLENDRLDFTNKGHAGRHDWGQMQIFWFQSRLIPVTHCWAYGSSSGTGFVYNIRGGLSRDIRPQTLLRRNIEPIMRYMQYFNDLDGEFYDANQSLTKVPPVDFETNRTVACLRGAHVIKSNSAQDHLMYSKFHDFRCYNVMNGVEFEYTGRYWVNDIYGVQDPITYGLQPLFEVLCFEVIEAFQFTFRNLEGYGFNYALDIDHVTSGSIGPAPPDDEWHNFVIRPNSGTFAGTYRIDDIDTSSVAVNGRDTLLIESDLASGSPTFVEDDIEFPDFQGALRFWTGTITDSIGTRALPVGRDKNEIKLQWTHGIGRLKGFWIETASDRAFVEIDEWITDAATGEDVLHTGRLYFVEGAFANDPRGASSGWMPGTYNGSKA